MNVTFPRRYGSNITYVDPVDIVLRYLAEEPDLLKALTRLVDSRIAWVYLANEIAEDPDDIFCDPDAELDTAIEKVCQALAEREGPRIRWPKRKEEYLDTFVVRAKLNKTENKWADMPECTDAAKLKHLGSGAWSYLEKLLKCAIRFYSEWFYKGVTDEIKKTFDEARKKKSANPLLMAIAGIEKDFRPKQMRLPDEEANGDTEEKQKAAGEKASKARSECFWKFKRNSPFEGLLDADVSVNLVNSDPDWLQSLEKFHSGLSGLMGRTESAEVKTLHWYQADVDYYRNFYAHAIDPAIINAGIVRAKESFKRARRIIERLAELDICPTLVVPVEDGVDGYGRRVVRFVRARDLKGMGVYPRDEVRYMYPHVDEVIELHEFYYCASPANSGLFEPVIYPACKITSSV